MTAAETKTLFVVIACGGTGGHLFPGLTVAEQLQKHGCHVALLISPKDVDQQAVKSARGMEVFTLPAVALQNRNYFSFARSFWQSWRAARNIFQARPPHAVLAMGGFTSAPPALAARKFGAKTFLHESNTIPGRANRLLACFVDEAFVGFAETAARFSARKVTMTGTPVRSQFQPRVAAECRAALGLEPARPTILVMGGSQGASGLNGMILSALPSLGESAKSWQWLHLTGPGDFERVKQDYVVRGLKALVKPFCTEMDLALGAATISVSRSGASSLAEIAAMRLPSLLVPYPAAADNHQFYNAQAFEATGAARLLEQRNATPEKVAALLRELIENERPRAAMQTALGQWHAPRAAELIVESILISVRQRWGETLSNSESTDSVKGGLDGVSPRQTVALSNP
jgi:UDP-N-acetylglucosamine--N-acetylmuramyl-(pentapeptide) pyrophosphoryl-undecaprenol N-acetylglucosamine transferase